MRPIFIVLLFPGICSIFSCSPSKKTAAPAAVIYKPIPDTLPALPVSEINLTLKAGAAYVLAKADSLVPRQFTSDNWPSYSQPSCGFRYKYRFLRSGLTVTCINNRIDINLKGSYQLSGARCLCTMNKPVSPWVSGSCGFGDEPMRHVNINVGSQLSFRPDYHIITTSHAGKLEAVDRCSVSLFSTDITQQVLDSIRSSLLAFCTALDETVAGMDFRTMALQAVQNNNGKTAISKYGYLSVNPSAIRIGRLNYIKDTFSISAGVSCRPELTSDSSHQQAAFSLPPLQQSENRNGISLYLNASYDYAFISKLLNDTLHNRVFEIKGRTIVIKEVSMKSAGNHQVEVKIDFAGSNKGRIFLRGTPLLDTAKQSLTMPDISYTIESGDLLLKIVRSLFKNKIRNTLTGSSYLDIAALVKSNLPMLDSMLNRKLTANILASGKINQLRFIGLLARKENIEAQFYTNATLSVIAVPPGR